MHDLVTEYFWHCDTAENWSTEVQGSIGTTYTVFWNSHGHKNQEVKYDYSCTCKSYKFGSGKHCKHIKEVKESNKHCKWMQFTDGDDVVTENGERLCPSCNAKAHSMGWAV